LASRQEQLTTGFLLFLTAISKKNKRMSKQGGAGMLLQLSENIFAAIF